MHHYVLEDTKNRMKISEITIQEYRVIEEFYPKYKWFESVMGAYKNYILSYQDYSFFYDSIISSTAELDLQSIHDRGTYLLTSNIILSRVFIDNVKSFIKQTGLKSIRKPLNIITYSHEMKLIKALRDYSIHFALPIKDTTRIYDAINERNSFSFYIYKSDLLKNTKNEENISIIKKHEEDKISVNELVVRNEENIKQIGEVILEEFVDNISPKAKSVLKQHVKTYSSESNKFYFPNAFVKCEKSGNHYIGRKYLGMDQELLKMIMTILV